MVQGTLISTEVEVFAFMLEYSSDDWRAGVQIRFQRGGRRKSPFYRIVAIDSKSSRDGVPIQVSSRPDRWLFEEGICYLSWSSSQITRMFRQRLIIRLDVGPQRRGLTDRIGVG
jgi:hypothetical protein